MDPGVQAAIVRAANEAGVNPAFALAVADRESQGDPTAHASRSIFGLFQMSAPLRRQYGIGDSTDPYTQAHGWTHFIGDVRNGMAQRLGRQPTDAELYMGHYFGEGRGARVQGMDPSTPVSDVFSPQELAANPNFGRAGTIGNLTSGITDDIGRRMARFGGQPGGPNPASTAIDFSMYGQPMQDTPSPRGAGFQVQPIDFAQFGQPQDGNEPAIAGSSPAMTAPNASAGAPDAVPSSSRPGTEIDLSQFGVPLPTADNMGATAPAA